MLLREVKVLLVNPGSNPNNEVLKFESCHKMHNREAQFRSGFVGHVSLARGLDSFGQVNVRASAGDDGCLTADYKLLRVARPGKSMATLPR